MYFAIQIAIYEIKRVRREGDAEWLKIVTELI